MDRAGSLFTSAVKNAKLKAFAAKDKAKQVAEDGAKRSSRALETATEKAMTMKEKASTGMQNLVEKAEASTGRNLSVSSNGKFFVELEKTESCSTLGLQLSIDGHGLCVNSLAPGLASNWNASQSSDVRIAVGDRIVALNAGTELSNGGRTNQSISIHAGNVEEILPIMRQARLLRLTFKRADTSSSSSDSAQPHAAGQARGQAFLAMNQPADKRVVAMLCALGFSAAAATHALKRCGGDPDQAGRWLVDAANADEIAAAELEAEMETDDSEDVEQVSSNQRSTDLLDMDSKDHGREALRADLLKQLGVTFKEFQICVRRVGDAKPLGIEVDAGKCMIRAVRGGLIGEWNADNGEDLQIIAGDVIVAVNSVDSSNAEIMHTLKNQNELHMTLRRVEDPFGLQPLSIDELQDLIVTMQASNPVDEPHASNKGVALFAPPARVACPDDDIADAGDGIPEDCGLEPVISSAASATGFVTAVSPDASVGAAEDAAVLSTKEADEAQKIDAPSAMTSSAATDTFHIDIVKDHEKEGSMTEVSQPLSRQQDEKDFIEGDKENVQATMRPGVKADAESVKEILHDAPQTQHRCLPKSPVDVLQVDAKLGSQSQVLGACEEDNKLEEVADDRQVKHEIPKLCASDDAERSVEQDFLKVSECEPKDVPAHADAQGGLDAARSSDAPQEEGCKQLSESEKSATQILSEAERQHEEKLNHGSSTEDSAESPAKSDDCKDACTESVPNLQGRFNSPEMDKGKLDEQKDTD